MLKKILPFEWFLIFSFSAGPFVTKFFTDAGRLSWVFLSLLGGYFIYRLWASDIKHGILFIGISILAFIAEIIGVKTGYLFGHYDYLRRLGPKILDVPVVIGINWGLLVYAGYIILNRFHLFYLNGLLCTLIDVMMEPIAPVLGFWKFHTGLPGVWNYASWFLLASLLTIIIHKNGHLNPSTALNKAAFLVYFCITIFYLLSYAVI
ncbi:MAG: carotenoid biosynthesis protein [Bacteroidia bacterium]|nr:carotenoid biosynthesis protein [Bacteroidia bacterium]